MPSILHAATECYPFAKVGGMADVVGALPKHLQKTGWNASVVLPVYDLPMFHGDSEPVFEGSIPYLETDMPFVVRDYGSEFGFTVYGIDIPDLFFRPGIYLSDSGEGYEDEVKRNISFQRAILTWWNESAILFDLLHCHDHMTGLMPFLMKHGVDYPDLRTKPTFFTIHNALYRGRFSWDMAPLLGSYDTWKWGLLDWSHQIDSLACAMKCADKVNVVSPQYLKELTSKGHDLQWIFEEYPDKFIGLLNGIDYEVWDPKTDPVIDANLTSGIAAFKKKNKRSLTSSFTKEDLPLFCFIGRFAHQKGVDILISTIRDVLDKEGLANFIILGSGDKALENLAINLLNDYSGQVAFELGYNETYSHKLYAGADFLLMPSRVEPCGLNQMLAFRYGTLPIVHATGGLIDTVSDIKNGGAGITIEMLNPEALAGAIQRAIEIFHNKRTLSSLRNKAIKLDFSWEGSAKRYAKEYSKLIKGE